MKKVILIIAIAIFTICANAQTFNLVKNVNLTPDNGYVSINCSFREMGGKMYYIFPDQAIGKKALYVTDGTSAGTARVSPINVDITDHLIVGGNKIYFFSSDSTNGREPWVSDGTTAGTFMLKDINASTDVNNFQTMSSTFLSADSNKAFFVADDGTTGDELWVTDGTIAGTQFVKDIFLGTQTSAIRFGTSGHGTNMLNGKIYFFAMNSYGTPTTLNGNEPWVSDGTATGTFMLKDIVPGYGGSDLMTSDQRQFLAYNGKMYFSVLGGSTMTYGGFYETDGTVAGTNLIFSTNGLNYINELVAFNNKIYLARKNSNSVISLWSSDGTAAGTVMVDSVNGQFNNPQSWQMTVANNELFLAADVNSSGKEVYKLDNTTNKITLVKEVCTGAASGINTNVYADRKVFQVYDNKV